jgi:hypothetical protein
MASATGSHPDTGSSVRPLPGSTIDATPGCPPALRRVQNHPLDRKRLRYRSPRRRAEATANDGSLGDPGRVRGQSQG